MLWTDASSREFIAEQYPWFLDTFDSYPYPIQRADAIRYFILHYYGGVYLDLDIGCLRRLDPLLVYPVILPRTIPVGVSNDLMFAEKGHPFMAQTIHNLVTFNHNWVLNYPTVMFSTGPMFVSAQYGLYTASHPNTDEYPGSEIRILPKSLYGKNAKAGEAPHSFFSHFYGSSWHADDAAFIGFLGKWGKILMWVGLAILILGVLRMFLMSSKKNKYGGLSRRMGGAYEVLLPRWNERNGRWRLDIGFISLPGRVTPSATPSSPTSSTSDDEVALLPLSIGMRPSSPAPSEVSTVDQSYGSYNPASGIVRRVRDGIASIFGAGSESSRSRSRTSRRRSRQRGVLFFLPAFATGGDISLSAEEGSSRYSQTAPLVPSLSRNNSYSADKRTSPDHAGDDIESALMGEDASSSSSAPPAGLRLPSYAEAAVSTYRPPTPDASSSRRPYSHQNVTPSGSLS